MAVLWSLNEIIRIALSSVSIFILSPYLTSVVHIRVKNSKINRSQEISGYIVSSLGKETY